MPSQILSADAPQRCVKYPEEAVGYAMDFSKLLVSGETITSIISIDSVRDADQVSPRDGDPLDANQFDLLRLGVGQCCSSAERIKVILGEALFLEGSLGLLLDA